MELAREKMKRKDWSADWRDLDWHRWRSSRQTVARLIDRAHRDQDQSWRILVARIAELETGEGRLPEPDDAT
jgi:hypothetical protein